MLAGALLDSRPVRRRRRRSRSTRWRPPLATGVPSDEVVARSPIVLTLIPPRIPPVEVPPGAVTAVRPTTPAPAPTLEGVTREALRVRVRWVHELSARAAAELGRRLAAAGVIPDVEAVRYLRLAELETVLRTGQPFHPDGRPDAMRRTQLPALFRLAADGTPIAIVRDVEGRRHPGRRRPRSRRRPVRRRRRRSRRRARRPRTGSAPRAA